MKNKKRFLLFTTLPCLPIATGAAIGLTSCTNQAPKYDPECRYKTKDGKFEVQGNKINRYLLNINENETYKNTRNVYAELIPNEVELDIGKKVTIDTIGYGSFSSGDELKFKLDSIIIDEGIKYIEQWAFNNNNIRTVSLPNSIEKIGMVSFANNKIENIKLSNNQNFVSIPKNAFYNDNHVYIKNINSLCNVKYVGNNAFTGFNTDNLDFFTKSKLEFIGSSSFNFYPMENYVEPFEFPKTLKGVANYCVTLPKNLNDMVNTIIKSDKPDETKISEIQQIIKVDNWEKIQLFRYPKFGEKPLSPDFPYVSLPEEEKPSDFLQWINFVFRL